MKTTILGILTLVSAFAGTAVKLLNGEPVDFATVTAAVTAGIGLIRAADSK